MEVDPLTAAGWDLVLRLAQAAAGQGGLVVAQAAWLALPVLHRPPGHRVAAIATRAV
jgi:hypothetical protein